MRLILFQYVLIGYIGSTHCTRIPNQGNKQKIFHIVLYFQHLEITPAIHQVCESVRVDEKVLIEKHMPLLCSGLRDREIRCNCLYFIFFKFHLFLIQFLVNHLKNIIKKGNDRTGEINKFFQLPLVKRLDQFRQLKEFKVTKIIDACILANSFSQTISRDRDELAHEALSDGNQLQKKWDMLLIYYQDSKTAEEQFEVEVGKDIGIIHNQIKKVSTESGLN